MNNIIMISNDILDLFCSVVSMTKNANVALLFVFLHTIHVVQVGLKINEFILNYMCRFTLGSSFFPLVQVFAVQYEA